MLAYTSGIWIAAELEWYPIDIRERSWYDTSWFREWKSGYDVCGEQNKKQEWRTKYENCSSESRITGKVVHIDRSSPECRAISSYYNVDLYHIWEFVLGAEHKTSCSNCFIRCP